VHEVLYDDTFPAVPVAVAAIRRAMGAVAEQCGIDERGAADVRLAVSEAASNAILHAYRGGDGVIRVRADMLGDDLRIVVSDEGTGIAPRHDSPGLGLGLPIITNVVRRMEIVSKGRGTEVHLIFSCPSASAA
jgi:serine/threonine-protein kinase RsbW/stage II sporulation protein AB (anti-sigma F factor)